MTSRTDGSERALKERVHARLLADAGEDAAGGILPSPVLVRSRLAEHLRAEEPLLGADRFAVLLGELLHEVSGLGALEPVLADPAVTELMVNGPGRAYVERSGVLQPVELHLDADTIVRLAERIIAPLGLRLDRSSPMVDARLADGSRLHAVLPPLAVDGPCLTIRRFGARRLELTDFEVGPEVGDALALAVAGGANVLVAGATAAGKTTLLNSLSAAIPAEERVVTIEETAELRLAQPHVVRLEARPANAEGAGAVSVRDLVRAALRMRPDRIVVGEVRGGEALDMLQALNTGHDGSLSTIHANGARDALRRLETLALFGGGALPIDAVRDQIASSVDLVVFVARHRGRRRVTEIAEVLHERDGRAGPGVHVVARLHDDELVVVDHATRVPRRPAHTS